MQRTSNNSHGAHIGMRGYPYQFSSVSRVNCVTVAYTERLHGGIPNKCVKIPK